MQDFFRRTVAAAKQASKLAEKIPEDSPEIIQQKSDILFERVLRDYSKPIKTACDRGKTSAIIFIYEVGTEYEGIPIYDFLGLTVLDRIKRFMHPFKVVHSIYEINDSQPVPLLETDFDLESFSRKVGVLAINWSEEGK